MKRYILKRLIMMIPLLFGITIISFSVIHLAPGEPIDMATDLNPKANTEMKNRLREYYGLDKPVLQQYTAWLGKILVLDFGRSFSPDRKPVLQKIRESLPKTIIINAVSMFFIFLIAIPIGIMSATHQYSFIDKFTTVFVFIGFATPTFWLALLLMLLFGVHWGVLPISGWSSLNTEGFTMIEKFLDVAKHLVLPIFVSSFTSLAGISRYMRGNMLEVIRQDYILTARAKGLKERTVTYKHALRNALLPVITIIGFSIPAMIGGSVIFESIFAIPGMGMLFYTSVMSRDYSVIMGILVIGAILTLIGNLVADVSYALADPRIRQE